MTTTKRNTKTTTKTTIKGKVTLTKEQKDAQLARIQKLSEKRIGGRSGSTIYVVDYEKMTDKEKRQFRNKMRTQLKKRINSILVADFSKNIDGVKEGVKEFQSFAKENYQTPQFDNVSNFYSGNDSAIIFDIQRALEIIQRTKV